MVVYRIVRDQSRTRDLSGRGAYLYGGRWNHPGTFALYTSANSSLAFLENIIHFDASEMPPMLFIAALDISDKADILDFPDKDLPQNWRVPDCDATKAIGNNLFKRNSHFAIKVRSAVNPEEHNILLNPLFPRFSDLVKVVSAKPFFLDVRFLKKS